MMDTIQYNMIAEITELVDVISLQKLIWGNDTVTPVPQLVAAIKNGGMITGSFFNGELIGFTYGFAGFKNHENYLVSHMTAVHPNYQNLGIGLKLKLKQRDWAINYGYKKIIWTYDPLESRNAFFNLNKLGAYVRNCEPSYYGEMNDKLNIGMPTDRFLVEWDISSERVIKTLAGNFIISEEALKYPLLLNWERKDNIPYPIVVENNSLIEKGYLLPIPKNIQHLKQSDLKLAISWRLAIRNAAIAAFSNGFTLTGILKMNQNMIQYYVFEKNILEEFND